MIDITKLTDIQLSLYCANLSSSGAISTTYILGKASENLKWLEEQNKKLENK